MCGCSSNTPVSSGSIAARGMSSRASRRARRAPSAAAGVSRERITSSTRDAAASVPRSPTAAPRRAGVSQTFRMSAIFPAQSLSAFLLAGRASVCWDSLMKISQKLEYACRALAQLAKHHDGRTLTRLEDLAQREAVSGNFLVQILNDLRRAGLIESRRGKAGGYLLGPHAGNDHPPPDRGRGGTVPAAMLGLPRRRIRPRRPPRMGPDFRQPAAGARRSHPGNPGQQSRVARCFTFEIPRQSAEDFRRPAAYP